MTRGGHIWRWNSKAIVVKSTYADRKRDTLDERMFKARAAIARTSPKSFFAVAGLVALMLLVSMLGTFQPSGNLAVYMAPRIGVANESGRAAKKFTTVSNTMEKPGCGAVNNGTAISARLSLKHLKPPPFLPEYKNPCWWHSDGRARKSLRCLPYFYLAGFPKCGTTDLYFRLTQHPFIVPALYKEPHYVTRYMYKTRCSSKYKYTPGTGEY
ncbi:hypothetical protein RRG08_019510 [Elysia crispata]|uniref:Uncharacterized protein n=1 Tax=Elysia crispata TaxID=231223 RepID=A0AAE0Z4S2_9GAST|nr:hypothetical protein RRG08_019510 [Elysia crispata]